MFFFSSRRRHTRSDRDWSSDVCSSDLTQVQAPITGTVLELDAVLGTVISSPTNDVGGGTVILKMANLDTVQVSALVDETDVGKVQAGKAGALKLGGPAHPPACGPPAEMSDP